MAERPVDPVDVVLFSTCFVDNNLKQAKGTTFQYFLVMLHMFFGFVFVRLSTRLMRQEPAGS